MISHCFSVKMSEKAAVLLVCFLFAFFVYCYYYSYFESIAYLAFSAIFLILET